MNLRIIKAGVMDTLQDMGRYGFQHLGINPGGAMDKSAAALANILVGNAPNETVLELHFPASEFFFEQSSLIAVTGADFSAHVNGEEIMNMQPVILSKYSILQFHRLKKGARAYLAIHGGFDVEPWLNSHSTHLKAAAGGYHGRPLQKDDEIPMRNTKDFASFIDKKEFQVLPWKADQEPREETHRAVRVIRGHEWNWLEDASKNKFLEQSFQISNQSDRMGYILKADALELTCKDELVSSVVNFGTVQLLPDGQLIILMADHQTTGGYPRAAHVIAADHSRLSQMKAGEEISFEMISHKEAEDLLLKQKQHLTQVQNACAFRLEQFMHA